MWRTGCVQGLDGCGSPHPVEIMKNVPYTPIQKAFNTQFLLNKDIFKWSKKVNWMCMGFLMGVESFNWVCMDVFMGVDTMGVYGCFDGCGMTKKVSTGCSVA